MGRGMSPDARKGPPTQWADQCRFPAPVLPTSNVESELHHIAVDHDVFLAVDTDLAARLGFGHGTGRDQVIEGHHLCLDASALQV